MAQFEITAQRMHDGAKTVFVYDNMTSSFTHLNGQPVMATHPQKNPWVAPITSRDEPIQGKGSIRRLKIQMGLSCNYECSYCSQRYVPRAEETNKDDVQPFLEQLPTWFDGGDDGLGQNVRIEFWGGEPFVYWKTFKPLADALHARYPHAQLSTITNGSLLDPIKNEWLDRLGFSVSISHDGPGYHIRGQDPFDVPEMKAAILDLYARLGPNRMSFNAMLHKENFSRAEINAWMVKHLGEDVRIGEGSYVDAYDEGGLESSMPDAQWSKQYARRAFLDIRDGGAKNMGITHDKIKEFVDSIHNARPAASLGQKCGMDKPSSIAVDLKGNVMTCQNVSAVSLAPNLESHKIGHVSDLSAVKLNTSTHWSKRADCSNCPVLQLCKGACMFLEGEKWEASCNSSYFDNVAFMAAGIEYLTGYAPLYIEGPQREERKDVFGFRPAPALKASPAKRKIIPIIATA